MPSPSRLPLQWFLVVFSAAALSPCMATRCAAAAPNSTLEQLTQVWKEEFGAPQLFGAPRQVSSAPSNYSPSAHMRSDQPHPAVAQVIVPEAGATSYGSGALIDVRERFGLVVTNWHVVRDARGPVEVVFPGGFRSTARALKVDPDWDLAALVIWRPPMEPVKLSTVAPQPGDQLTICGYGQGAYRSATGRCTQYYAPRKDFPLHMVELDVEARQGDSGGPIFNERGELAGVLFGAGQGTTLGSFGGRVESFLATLAPDIGKAADDALVSYPATTRDKPTRQFVCRGGVCYPADSVPEDEPESPVTKDDDNWQTPEPQLAGMWAAVGDGATSTLRAPLQTSTADSQIVRDSASQWRPATSDNWFEQAKTALAAIGLLTLGMLLLKAVC
jgi:hypothetical protein